MNDPTRPDTNFVVIANRPQQGFLSEFWYFVKNNKKWWLTPIVVVLLILGLLLVIGSTSAAPFIYTLF